MQLRVGKRLAEGDVLPDGGVEEEDVLLDVTHLLLQLFGGDGAQVGVVKIDLPGVVRQPAQQELEQRGLATAGRPGEGVLFAFFKAEGSVGEDGLFTVGKRDVLHAEGVGKSGKRLLRALRGALRLGGQLFKVGLCRRQGEPQVGQLGKPVGHPADEVDAAHEDAQPHGPTQGEKDDPEHGAHLQGDVHKAHDALHGGLGSVQGAVGLLDGVADLSGLGAETLLPPEGFEHVPAGEGIFQPVGGGGLLGGTGAAQLLHFLVKELGGEPHHQRRKQGVDHQRPVQKGQTDDAGRHLRHPAHAAEKRRPGQLLQLLHVVCQPREVFADVLFVVLAVALCQQGSADVRADAVV